MIAEIKKYVQFQLPYMYSHMLALFVHLNNILIALACGAAIAVSVGDLVRPSSGAGDRLRAMQAIAVQVFILLIQPLVYQAFLEIASTLCDPFTHKDYGMPLHQQIDELRSLIKTGNELQAMDLDQIEVEYAETKKEKLARLLRKASQQQKEEARKEAAEP